MAEMQKEMSKSWEFLSSGPYLIFVAHAKNFKVRGNFSIFNAKAEMEKRADTADISVLFFSGCANILAVYAN